MAAAPPPADVLLGRTLGHYRIDQVLGRGGMGVVYRAFDLRLGRPVALKTVRPEAAAGPGALARLEREARAAARLSHPAIATLLDYDRVEGTAFVVYEYLEGVTLRDHARHRLATGEVVAIGKAVAEALATAHRAGILHRDVKPENVMVLGGGSVKLLDFGLARRLPGAPPDGEATAGTGHLTAEGAVIGTVAYMSPEQLEGAELDAASDVFALGVVLHELVSGRHPFSGPSAAETIASILHPSPPPLPGDCPPALARLIAACLARSPAARPAAADVARDLSTLVAGGEPALALTAATAGVPGEREYVLPRALGRVLLALIQVAYLVMYLVAFSRGEGLGDGLAQVLAAALPGRWVDAVGALLLTVALLGTAVRLYLLSLVAWDHVLTGVRFRRLFPLLFALDALWALTPLALLPAWGMMALPAAAPLAFAPFAQRTLVRAAWDPGAPRRISSG